MIRLGIDLGGTKTEIIALDERRSELLRRREPTPGGDYDAILKLIARLVRETEIELGKRGSVGVGAPGALSPAHGRIRNSNSTCLNGRALKDDIERTLGREIRIANDANCFALSEAIDGAGRGAPTLFGVILGTGVGGGIAVNGGVLEGANSIAGEWGHNALPWPEPAELPGPPCYCGKTGCIETYLCGPALERDGDLALYAERLARSLATVVNLLDPDVVVLGGGVSNVTSLYERVPQLWQRHIFSDHASTRLARNVHGDSSGVRGAAWLWG